MDTLNDEATAGVSVMDKLPGALQVVAERAAWAEQNGCLHPEAVEALKKAGVFRMRTPARFGGLEASAQAFLDVGSAISKVHGSTGWVSSVYSIPTYMATLFPEQTQCEVFDPVDVRVCGTLSPGGLASPTDGGGAVLDGKWSFISGAHDAQWMEAIAVRPDDQGNPVPIIAMVPMADMHIINDWDASGMRGSGSVTVVADQVKVPEHRIIPLGAALKGTPASPLTTKTAPLLPLASASSAVVPVGLAEAALEHMLNKAPTRPITYTTYESQAAAPVTHLAAGRVAMLADEARHHATALAGFVDGRTANDWTINDRIKARAHLGRTCELARDAVELAASHAGASSLYAGKDEIRRILNDTHAVCLHALMNPNTNAELFGRSLCGQEPNTLYI